jgi:hypothetical protein
MMIQDVFKFMLSCDQSDFIHIILITADNDFHNLLIELRQFENLITHSLSAQSGSALTALAHLCA